MMRSRLIAPLILSTFAASTIPPHAFADTSFTPAQRQAIVAIVREALKQDPSIRRDAVVALRAEEARDQEASQQTAVAAHRAELADGSGDAVAGNRNGDVTLVEFYDPRCPYCRRMVPTIDRAIQSDPKLRVVFKVIPILGPQSVLESRAIVAAGRQGGYVAMQEALMGETMPATPDLIAQTARTLKLDPVRLAQDMKDPTVTGHLEQNVALAKSLHIDGTPALVVGDSLISGAMSLADMQKAVSDARG